MGLYRGQVVHLRRRKSGEELDFFLDHYREQLSAGYAKLTPDSGLRVYIKDYNKLHPAKASPGSDKPKRS
jgi:hypothetical protein